MLKRIAKTLMETLQQIHIKHLTYIILNKHKVKRNEQPNTTPPSWLSLDEDLP